MVDDTRSVRGSRWARVYAGLFRVFGPAQLGDPDEAAPPPLPVPAPCPRCGRAMAEHGFVTTAERNRLRCP
jgi:hypothetical protein